MDFRGTCLFIAVLGLFAFPTQLSAGGFYVPYETTTGLGRAFAGDTAAAEDPSTIFSNPAGMTELSGAQVSTGLSLIIPSLSFENLGSTASTPGTLGTAVPIGGGDGGNPGNLEAVPYLYGALPLANKKLWLGIGVTSPFGNSLDYDSGWFGRYDTLSVKLRTIDVAPSVAYKVTNFLSLGAGLDVQYADASLSNAIPNTLVPGGPTAATDGLSSIDANDLAVGFNIGVLVEPRPGTKIGAQYRSGITHNLSGQVSVSGLTGPLAAANGTFDATSELNLPPIVSLGISQQLSPNLTVFAGGQWFGWSSFDELRIQFANGQPDAVLPQHYRDSYTASIGAEYKWNDDLTLRGGFQFDETPTVDAFRNAGLPDGNRYRIGIGATYHMTDRATLDFAYAHIFFDPGAVDLTHTFFNGSPAQGSVTTDGVANTSLDVVSLGFRYSF